MIVDKSNIVSSIDNRRFKMLLAGVAGIGKTTLALSSPSPLLIDLEKGSGRVKAYHLRDTLQCSSINELKEDLENCDLSKYETLIIDTGEALFEILKKEAIKEDLKNAKRDGSLSLAGYGCVKKKFKEFTKYLSSFDKNIIYIFHATEVALENDLTGLRIRVEGGTKDEIWDDIDLGGFIEIKANTRVLSFENCERFYAKKIGNFEKAIFELPNVSKNPHNDFLTRLFDQIKTDLKEEEEEYEEYLTIMGNYISVIDNIKTLEDLNNVLLNLKEFKNHKLTSKEELSFRLNQKAKELGFKYNKETKLYE